MTLIELIFAAAIGVIIVAASGAAFIVTIKANSDTRNRVAESHDTQLLSSYVNADLLSTPPSSSNRDTAQGSGNGCSVAMPELYNFNVLKLTWSQQSVDYVADYRVRQQSGEWQLVRYGCDSGGGSADVTVVGHNLDAPAPLPSPTTLPVAVDISSSGSRVTLTVTEASGYSYSVTGYARLAATESISPSPSPTPSTPAPTLVSLVAKDTTGNGQVDQVQARFSSDLTAACLIGYSMSNIPSGGAFVTGVATSGSGANANLATLTISELATGSPNTAVPSNFGVSFNPSASCPFQGFSNQTPVDQESPIVLTSGGIASSNTGGTSGLGKMESGDSFSVTFSEPIAGLPASPTVTETSGNGSARDTYKISGLTPSGTDQDTGGGGNGPSGTPHYITNNSASFGSNAAGSTAGVGWTYTVTLTGPCSGTGSGGSAGCSQLSQGGPGTLVFTPASSLADAAGNSINNAAVSTSATFRLF